MHTWCNLIPSGCSRAYQLVLGVKQSSTPYGLPRTTTINRNGGVHVTKWIWWSRVQGYRYNCIIVTDEWILHWFVFRKPTSSCLIWNTVESIKCVRWRLAWVQEGHIWRSWKVILKIWRRMTNLPRTGWRAGSRGSWRWWANWWPRGILCLRSWKGSQECYRTWGGPFRWRCPRQMLWFLYGP